MLGDRAVHGVPVGWENENALTSREMIWLPIKRSSRQSPLAPECHGITAAPSAMARSLVCRRWAPTQITQCTAYARLTTTRANQPSCTTQARHLVAHELPRPQQKAGIRYRYMAGLGGLWHARRDSINTGWRNAGFRGFADYMQTTEFQEALDQLIQLAQKRRTAIMSAEAEPWRCHRPMVGDALLVRGVRVEEITSLTRTRPHTLTTPWARVRGKQLSYPAYLEDTQAVVGRTM